MPQNGHTVTLEMGFKALLELDSSAPFLKKKSMTMTRTINLIENYPI